MSTMQSKRFTLATSCLALLTLAPLAAPGAQQPGAPELYRPRAIRQAYEKGTRSPD